MERTPQTLASTEHKNRPNWVMEWQHLRDIFTVHALCLLAPFNFTWKACWVVTMLSVITGLFGIIQSYYMNLAPIFLEYLFAYFGFYALQGWNNKSLLEHVGLATDVKLPSETHKQKFSFMNGSNDMKLPSQLQKWRVTDIFNVTVLIPVHGLCLFAPSNFNWSAFWVSTILYFITGLVGITLSYHRNLSHRSFKLPKYLEYLFAYFGLLALQGDPIFWVSTHRYHHKFSDKDQDPHSPIQGFWFSHIYWLFNYNKILHEGGYSKNVADLKSQSYYKFLQKTSVFHVLLLSALLYIFGGFPFIVWGMGVRTALVFHVTFMVNSVCHIWGHQAWNTGDLSKNNWFVGLFAFGEGWHNNQHAFEFSARHGLEWWQIDMTWYVIELLERIGLATEVKLPSETRKQKMSFKNFKNGENDIKVFSKAE